VIARILLLPMLLALCGCVSTAPNASIPAADDQAVIAPNFTCVLPPPGAAGGNINVAQSIVAHFRGQTFFFEAQIQATQKEFDLVALDSLGRRAMSVKWRDGHMDSTRADWLPLDVRPADILADVAIVYWPKDAIARGLAACGAELKTTANGREVMIRSLSVITVSYESGDGWNRAAHLRNPAFGFDIDIRSAEIAP
jgi:Protein of unknown function (DUF3261)